MLDKRDFASAVEVQMEFLTLSAVFVKVLNKATTF